MRVDTPSEAALLSDLRTRLSEGRGFSVATLNLDHLVKLRRDDAFRRAYAAMTHVVADGNPIVWLSRLQRRPVGLVQGSNLVDPLCRLAAETGAPIALVGSTEEVLSGAAQRLAKAHPGLRVALLLAPPFALEPEGSAAQDCVRRVGESGARLCLLALGAPKQERFSVHAFRALPHVGFVSVGAGIDFVVGAQARAPSWMRRLALEWLWRAASQPRRLVPRYLACLGMLPGLVVDSLRSVSETAEAREKGVSS